MNKISGILSGVTGEYFVAAELSRRGYIATLTSKNTKGIDLLASNQDASRMVGIQIKTNQGSRKAWLLNEKSETFQSDNLYYIFVNLNEQNPPDFFVVPSETVIKEIIAEHKVWIENPGRNGQPRNETSMRMFNDPECRYQNRWDLLGLDNN